MTIAIYILMDLLLIGGLGFLIYKLIHKFFKKEKKVTRPNMEVFHNPCLRQNTLKDTVEGKSFDFTKYNDGNNMMRERLKNMEQTQVNTDVSYLNF